jgi:hypothetical protein
MKMKRALAFLVFGPLLASGTALLVMAQTSGPDHGFAKILATAVFFFTLPVAAITACVDSVLHDVPISVRAGLTATIGAIVTFSLVFLLFGWSSPPRSFLMFLAFGGAACMGLCSVLAHDFGWQGFTDPKKA